MKNYIIETFSQQRRQICSALKFTVVTLFLLLYSHVSVFASEKNNGEVIDQTPFLVFKIEGVSLNTPLEAIPNILEKQGFTQTGGMTYTKQNQVPGQRRSIYRVEINDTESLRQITYFRGESGGRVKSSVKERALLPAEADMAKQLYALVCNDITVLEKSERSCFPVTEYKIKFGHGEFLEIGAKIGAQLNAYASTTIIAVRYLK